MKLVYLSIVPILLLTACHSTHIINYEDLSYNKEINNSLKGEKVTLELINGKIVYGYGVEVTTSSTYIGEKFYSTKEIKKISYTNHGKGALKGLGYGFIGGASLGFLWGYVSYSDSEPAIIVHSAGQAGMMGASVCGGLGAIIGLTVGAISGDGKTFIFDSQKKESKAPTHIEFSEIVKEGSDYIIILYRDKEIRLLSSEYNEIYINPTSNKKYIIVPKEVYLEKFK